MKIEYDFENCDWKTLNEIMGITSLRKKMKEDKDCKLQTYVSIMSSIIPASIIWIFILLIIFPNLKITYFFIGLIVSIVIMFTFLTLFTINPKNMNTKGTIEINKDFIIDTTDDISYTVPLDKIEYIVIGNRSIVLFITSSKNLCLYFPIKYGKQIIKEIKKYKEDILVLNKKAKKGENNGKKTN